MNIATEVEIESKFRLSAKNCSDAKCPEKLNRIWLHRVLQAKQRSHKVQKKKIKQAKKTRTSGIVNLENVVCPSANFVINIHERPTLSPIQKLRMTSRFCSK